MNNISDIIEQFILDNFCGNEMNIARNEMADYFSCAPSQINYVLSTRFSPMRGYIIESRRGGGGYIRLVKLNIDKNKHLKQLADETIGDELTWQDFTNLLSNLSDKSILTEAEHKTLLNVCSQKSLASPFKIENRLRANIVKNFLLHKCREKIHE